MSLSIGYKSTPEHTRYKPGTSGNPRGRPKGSRNFAVLLAEELDAKVVIQEGGKKKTVTRMQAMVKRLVAGSLQGDLKSVLALVEILRRTGQLDTGEAESMLPDDYEELLSAFVAKKSAAVKKKP